jgi:hypothetical protein
MAIKYETTLQKVVACTIDGIEKRYFRSERRRAGQCCSLDLAIALACISFAPLWR